MKNTPCTVKTPASCHYNPTTVAKFDDVVAKPLTEQLTKIGRYIIITLVNEDKNSENYGLRGVGISRCSQLDKFDEVSGYNKAKSRAMGAYYKKKAGRQLRNWYEG